MKSSFALIATTLISSAAFANIDAFPSSLTFRDTQIGQRSLPQQVTVTNRGPGRIDTLEVNGSCTGFDIESGTCLGPLGQGQSCYISIAFNPRYEGSASCSVSVRGGAFFDSISAQGRGVRKAFPEPSVSASNETQESTTLEVK